jgi:hypothetical protein
MEKSSIALAQLRNVKSLARLNDSQLVEFLKFVELVPWPQQTILFEEGQPGDCMYFILQGQMRIFSRKSNGEAANCAKSIVTREGCERAVKGYVVPKVGLPWPEWINT